MQYQRKYTVESGENDFPKCSSKDCTEKRQTHSIGPALKGGNESLLNRHSIFINQIAIFLNENCSLSRFP